MKQWLINLKYGIYATIILGMVFICMAIPYAYLLTQGIISESTIFVWPYLIICFAVGEFVLYKWDRWVGRKESIISRWKDGIDE